MALRRGSEFAALSLPMKVQKPAPQPASGTESMAMATLALCAQARGRAAEGGLLKTAPVAATGGGPLLRASPSSDAASTRHEANDMWGGKEQGFQVAGRVMLLLRHARLRCSTLQPLRLQIM